MACSEARAQRENNRPTAMLTAGAEKAKLCRELDETRALLRSHHTRSEQSRVELHALDTRIHAVTEAISAVTTDVAALATRAEQYVLRMYCRNT